MTNFSGRYFGHHYLQKRIGGGGYADVYKAVDIFLDRDVAVKVLKVRGDPDDLQDVLRSAREARTVVHLKHPHIVTVIEFNYSGTLFKPPPKLDESERAKTLRASVSYLL